MMTAQSDAGEQIEPVPENHLEDENKKLRHDLDQLKKVNNQQIQRLVQQELLQIRIKELEQQNRLLEQRLAATQRK